MTEEPARHERGLRDRSGDPWKMELNALIAGPYAGHGGLGDLARDLDITRSALDKYRSEGQDRRDPIRANRLKIRALYEQHGLHLREQ